MTDEEYWLWLCNIKGIGNKKISYLLHEYGVPENVYKASKNTLYKIRGINNADVENIILSKKKFDTEKWLDKMRKLKIGFVYYGHDSYPQKLENIYDKPYVLYYRGCLPEDDRYMAGIIGARAGSAYGFSMAYNYAKYLAECGIDTVSGMARGTDSYAHRGTLDGGGRTFAIMGCGIDICYPAENIELYERIIENGGIISEYFIGIHPVAGNFPTRNRIISAFSDDVLVMEAKEKSGSLITVEYALEQGKDVYALPGRVTDDLSKGCNALIKSGAGILTTPKEYIQDISMDVEPLENMKMGGPVQPVFDDEATKKVYEALDINPKFIQQIMEETNYDEATVAKCLVKLQIDDMVNEPARQYYIRKD